MAVVLRGWTQMTAQAASVSVAWPAGTAAGDVAVVVTDGNSTLAQRGWTSYTEGVFAKVLGSADIAAALLVDDTLAGLQVFSGARGIGAARYRNGSAGLTLSEAGAGLFVHGWSPKWDGDIDPDASRLGNKIDHEHYMNAVWWVAGTTTGYLGLSGTDRDAAYVSYEILPATVPAAPVVTGPVSGSYVDAAAAIGVSWIAAGQTSVKVKLTKVSDSSVVWLKSDGTVTATETAIATAALSASINAGQLTAAQAYDVRVAAANALGYSVFSDAVRFTPLARPTVTSVTVTCPAEDLSPLVAWTMTASLGTQQGWQVRICASADATPDAPIWDSGVRSGAALNVTAPADTPWTNEATLAAWVRVMDSAQWSAWTKDDATFAVDWTPPAAPSLVTAANQASGPLQVSVTRGALNVQLWYRPAGDIEWTYLGSFNGIAPDPVVFDVPIAPYGVQCEYAARTWTVLDGQTLYSDFKPYNPSLGVTTIASTDTGAYLVSITDCTDYLPVQMVEDGRRVLAQGVATSYGMGAGFARVDRSLSAGQSGSTVLISDTATDRAAVVAWLTGRAVWWMRWSPERHESTYADVPATRMAMSSAASWQRLAQVAIQHRHVSFDWVEQ